MQILICAVKKYTVIKKYKNSKYKKKPAQKHNSTKRTLMHQITPKLVKTDRQFRRFEFITSLNDQNCVLILLLRHKTVWKCGKLKCVWKLCTRFLLTENHLSDKRKILFGLVTLNGKVSLKFTLAWIFLHTNNIKIEFIKLNVIIVLW